MIFEELNINCWTTVEDIQKLIERNFDKKMSRRALRKEREKFNEKYYNHETNFYIARSSKGYIKTVNDEIIRQSEDADRAMALDLLTKVSKSRRARGENYTIRLEIKDDKLMYMEGE